MAVTVTTAALAAMSAVGTLAHASAAASAHTMAARAVPCVQHLQATHTYRTEEKKQGLLWTYKTDAKGRPVLAKTSQAGSTFSQLKPKPTNMCDVVVARWGGPGYTATRLIPSHLGGESHRADLVPVTKSADKILVKAMDDAAKACAHTENYLLKYTGTAHYKNDGVIPSRISMRLDVVGPFGSPAANGATVRLDFANKNYTKASAKNLTTKFSKQVKAAGCTTAG
jgi:hypothetical protein